MKLLLLIVALFGAGARSDDEATLQTLNAANNAFTAKMFTEVVKENPSKSIVMSAFSVLTPLAQLAFASEGPTHDELLKTIGMPNDNVTKEVFSLVNTKVKAVSGGVELRMASRIYVDKDAELNEEFQAISRSVFGTDSRNIDFNEKEKAANMINAWVEDQTNHRIKDLVSPDGIEGARSVLVNAIYFKGKWKDQFKVADTKDRDFHLTKERTVKLPTMYRKGEYQYAESDELNAQLLRLPYEGGDASMLIVLPKEIDGLAALEKKLKDPTVLTKAIENMNTYDVEVYLPKFKIETTIDLKTVLNNIDCKRLFSPTTALLTRLIKKDTSLYVSKAVQKAFIEVNEEGAEAAAGNAFVKHSITPSMPKPPPKIFQADRAFYYAIQAKGITIFNGAISY